MLGSCIRVRGLSTGRWAPSPYQEPDREGIRTVLELTVNGIAGGLKNTG